MEKTPHTNPTQEVTMSATNPTNAWTLDGDPVDFSEMRAAFVAAGRPADHDYLRIVVPAPTPIVPLVTLG